MSLAHFVDATAAKRGLGRRLFVDIDALVANWKLLQSRVQPAECSAVVKANAFGIGAKPVVHRLMLAAAKLSSSQTLRSFDSLDEIGGIRRHDSNDVFWDPASANHWAAAL
jgi:hypothetical protein